MAAGAIPPVGIPPTDVGGGGSGLLSLLVVGIVVIAMAAVWLLASWFSRRTTISSDVQASAFIESDSHEPAAVA
jgi:uncharacterized membrane protein